MKDSQWGALGFLTTERKSPSQEIEADASNDERPHKFNPLIKLSAVERENVEYVNSQFSKARNIYATGLPLRVWPGRKNKAIHIKRMSDAYLQNAIAKIEDGGIVGVSNTDVGRRWASVFKQELTKRGSSVR